MALTRAVRDAERALRAPGSPGGPLRTLSGNALQQRLPFGDSGKECAAVACMPAPAQLATPTAGAATALSPGSMPAPLSSALPRGARLMRLGLSSMPSPPKMASTRARGDDDNTRLVVACTAALLAAVVLLGAGAAALRPRRVADVSTSTALVPFNAAAAADQARRLYPVGQAMMLPFAPQPLHCHWLAVSALSPHAAWSHCGEAAAPSMPALPSGAEALQPGELALAAVAAVAAAGRMTAEAYGMLAERASGFMEANAAGPADAHKQALAAAATGLLLAVALALLRIATHIATHRRRSADADVDEASESFEEGEDEVEMEPLDDDLVTPQSGIDEEFSYSHSAQGIDSDLAELPEGELRDSWPLVSTPAVTRLLSFSRVASPAGSMRTSIGYGAAVPASAQQRRSRRLAGRDATVASVGVPPPTRGSVQRKPTALRSQQR